MISFDVRLKNFLESISFFADKSAQRDMWAQAKPHGRFSASLGELYAQFFDDNDIDNFILEELDASPLTRKQRTAVRSFRDALNDFTKAPGKTCQFDTDAKLLDDPEWNRLIELARAALDEFLPH